MCDHYWSCVQKTEGFAQKPVLGMVWDGMVAMFWHYHYATILSRQGNHSSFRLKRRLSVCRARQKSFQDMPRQKKFVVGQFQSRTPNKNSHDSQICAKIIMFLPKTYLLYTLSVFFWQCWTISHLREILLGAPERSRPRCVC